MKGSIAFLFCGMLVLASSRLQGQDQPAVTGYVTRVVSGSDFDANGIRVVCGEQTVTLVQVSEDKADVTNGCPPNPPYFGEPVDVFGYVDTKKNEVEAKRIQFPFSARVNRAGAAVVEVVKGPETPGPQPQDFLLRTDGRWIRIGSKTKLKFTPPSLTLAAVKPGDWIEYRGYRRSDGEVVAESVKLGPDAPGKGEEDLKEKKEYDPAAVPPDARQNYWKDSLTGGLDPKRFPAYKDPTMQARIKAIGEKLVPNFQRNLPDSDPAKIHFRFQLIDAKWPRDVQALPNGIVLIPHQVVERMQNDSQLATLLADGIASALERQEYRSRPAKERARAVSLGVLVPFVGAPVGLTGMKKEEDILIRNQEQRARVSLSLLHDAGYDIDQAPIAWWLIASRKPKPLTKIELPDRAAYFYLALGEIWHSSTAGVP